MSEQPPPPPGPAARQERRAEALAAALVAGVALASFALCLGGGFALDDRAFLPPGPNTTSVRNPLVFFGGGIWDFSNLPVEIPLYRPMTTVVLWALAPLLGASPAAWHAPSLAVHAVASVLVYALARRLLPSAGRFPSLAGALLFAAHPVHAEAVAPALGFGHSLVGAFGVLALHAQLSHARGGGPASLAASAAASALAMFTTEGGLAVPAAAVALEWAHRGARPPARVFAAAAVPVVLVLALRARALGDPVPLRLDAASLGLALEFLAAYLRNLLLPWPQPFYLSVPRGGLAGPLDWTLAALALVGAALAVARAPRAERGLPAFAAVLALLGTGPLVLAALGPRPLLAPRGLYLASVGLALLAAWGASRLRAPPRRTVPALAALVALGAVGCGAATLGWRDDVRVYRRVLQADPEFSSGHLILGRLLAARGDRDGALRHLGAAARLSTIPSERLDATEELATEHGSAGRLAEAEGLFRAVLADDPGRARSWLGLGNLALLRGDAAGARDAYERAVRLAPDVYEGWHNLALARAALGDAAGAAEAGARARALAR